MQNHKIVVASLEDAKEILNLQKLAYLSEAEIINDYSIPPFHQTLQETESEFKKNVVLKIEVNGVIIGSVRGHREGVTCFIGKLIVHPDYQKQGIGSSLLKAAEDLFPGVRRYELFTGEKSVKNLHIYRKFGYRIFKKKTITEKLTLVFLEKEKIP